MGLIVLGIIVILTIFFVALRINGARFGAPNINELRTTGGSTATSTPSNTPQPSSQESVDTSLSLKPSENGPTSPPTSSTSYNGCELSLAFNITGGNIAAPGDMNYDLISKNVGNATCDSASISVYYADNETFVSSVPKATDDGYYWQFGDLSPGEEKDISLATNRTVGLESGDAVNEACLSANNGSDACSNSSSSAAPTTATPQAQLVSSLSPQPNKELGVWVWTPIGQMTTSTMEQTIDEVAENNFNTIYVTVDEYLSIDPSDTSALQQYDDEVSAFLSLASQKGIVVDAESGSSGWAMPANQSKPEEIMAWVSAYNQSHAYKFRGVQYDIEPYLLPGYDNDEGPILTEYAQLTDQLANEAKTDGLPLTMVLPHFFDDVIQWTPQVTVDGITDYTYNQIIRILNQTTGNRVIIMAYRNFAAGPDGSIDLSQTEVSEADDTNVKVLVAQETGPVQPSYVTFYGSSLSDLATQVNVINEQFDSDKSFAGISIDYLDPFLLLSN